MALRRANAARHSPGRGRLAPENFPALGKCHAIPAPVDRPSRSVAPLRRDSGRLVLGATAHGRRQTGASWRAICLSWVCFLYARQGLSVQVAPQIKELGLILFVYAVGLTSGSGFFSAFRTRGVRLNLALLGILVASAGLL